MKIQLKRSNVLEGGSAKEPTAQQMEYGELAVNYNANDPAIFMEDSDGNIIRIAGAGAPGGFSGDYNDLTNKPTIGDGKITIKDSSGNEIGSFTVNQDQDGDITLPEDQDEDQIHVGTTYPNTPELGDLWLNTSECPPELNVWSDCNTPGGEWETIGGGTAKPIDPTPGDGNNSITPTPPGSGTEADPYVLTEVETQFGSSVQTVETITFSNQRAGALVQFVDQNSGTNGNRYSQPIGVIGDDGTWSGKLYFTDVPSSTVDTTFTGLLKIGDSSIYYSWNVKCSQPATIDQPEILFPPENAGLGNDETYTPKTAAITDVNSTVTALQPSDFIGGTQFNDGGWSAETPAAPDASEGINKLFDGNPSSRFFLSSTVNTAEYTYEFPPTGQKTGVTNATFTLSNYQNIQLTIRINYTDSTSTTQYPTVGNTTVSIDTDSAKTIKGFGFYKTDGSKSANYGFTTLALNGAVIGGPGISTTELTFADGNTYDADTDENRNQPISKTFLAGQTVSNGAGVTGTLVANASGTTMLLGSVTGQWSNGMEVINDNEATSTGPGADDLEFVGSIPNGTDITTWGVATWEVTDVDNGGTMTDTKAISDASSTQTLAVGDRSNINLAADTTYNVRLKYTSTDPAVESLYSDPPINFRTASTTRELFPDIYYDKGAQEPISGDDLSLRYGIDPETADLSQLGIAELTEQPTYPVAGYVADGDKYRPIEDQFPRINQLKATLENLESRLSELEGS